MLTFKFQKCIFRLECLQSLGTYYGIRGMGDDVPMKKRHNIMIQKEKGNQYKSIKWGLKSEEIQEEITKSKCLWKNLQNPLTKESA